MASICGIKQLSIWGLNSRGCGSLMAMSGFSRTCVPMIQGGDCQHHGLPPSRECFGFISPFPLLLVDSCVPYLFNKSVLMHRVWWHVLFVKLCTFHSKWHSYRFDERHLICFYKVSCLVWTSNSHVTVNIDLRKRYKQREEREREIFNLPLLTTGVSFSTLKKSTHQLR